MDGQTSFFAEHLRKGLGFARLRAQVAGHVERVPDDNLRTTVFPNNAQERFCVLAAVGANQRHNRLGGQPQCVRNGDSDAPVADIEAKQSPMRIG